VEQTASLKDEIAKQKDEVAGAQRAAEEDEDSADIEE
jgi:hypothetical protein